MVLPSIADILIVVVLLVPGFVAFFFVRRIPAMEQKFTDLEMTAWSVFFSLIIYVPFSYATGLSDLDSIRNALFFPSNFLVLAALTLAVGLGIGGILKIFRRGIYLGNTWKTAVENLAKMGDAATKYIIVHTMNGLEYKGRLYYADESGDRKEFIIKEPLLVLRDNNWNVVNEFKVGEEIYFRQNDVLRVIFLDSF